MPTVKVVRKVMPMISPEMKGVKGVTREMKKARR